MDVSLQRNRHRNLYRSITYGTVHMKRKTRFMLETEQTALLSRLATKSKHQKLDELKLLGTIYSEQNRLEPTLAELKVMEHLDRLGIEYIHEHPVVIWTKEKMFKLYLMDFYLPKRNTCLEVDGEYHLTDSQKEYDSLRDKRIACPTVRIDNSTVLSPEFDLEKYL